MTAQATPTAAPAPTVTQLAQAAAQAMDSRLHAAAARLTGGLSPVALSLAWADWALHLATQPTQAAQLALSAQQAAWQWLHDAGTDQAQVPPGDPRYAHPGWKAAPWVSWAQAHRQAQDWWDQATALRGMSPHYQEVVRFFARQSMDMLSPANLPLLNPEVLERSRERRGANLSEGAALAMDDWRVRHGLEPLGAPFPPFRPGHEVALTPGRVVHRNHLVELIQYSPSTDTVAAEPVFIVPSWIMKYYILDLSPHNSMVRWLVSQGHTVFILSWRNPDESDAGIAMADYLQQGIFDPLAAIARLLPGQSVHAAGYCLGGTLLAIGAAALSRPGQVTGAAAMAPLRSVSLLATVLDFSEPGEMGVLIDEAQVSLLEDMMAERGFLTGAQMGGSFAFLHSREMVWSHALRELWLGEPNQPNDLMAWNADATRMPAAMHSEYLRRCYLRNELVQGRYPVEGRAVALSDIHLPVFVVSTETDHVAPWRSVHKVHRLADTDIRFVRTSGGHNAGIVSEPGHPRRHYAVLDRPASGHWLEPEHWSQSAQRVEGSWWLAWHDWLITRGSGQTVPARQPLEDAELGPAPGRNVLVRYVD